MGSEAARRGVVGRALLTGLGLLALLTAARAGTWYVDPTAGGAGSGTSWADAFTDLHTGLAAALDGDTVLLAQGVYTPALAPGDRDSAFVVPQGVTLRGGHGGASAPFPDLRGPAYASILSGDNDGDDGLGSTTDNAYNVVIVATAAGAVTRLEGLTLEAGTAEGPLDEQREGAGVRHDGPALLVLRDCVLRGHRSDAGGSAVSSTTALTLEGCLIEGNDLSAVVAGGDSRLLDCVVRDNVDLETALFIGQPAVSLGDGSQVLGCRFEGNLGGAPSALRLTGQGLQRTRLVRSDFVGNQGVLTSLWPAHGGAVRVIGDALDVVDCRFFDNLCANLGGEPFAEQALGGALMVDAAVVTGCVFGGNDATSAFEAAYGGGLSALAGAEVSHCSFASNSADNGGGGLHVRSPGVPGPPKALVSNSVFWGNSGGSAQAAQLFAEVGGLINLRYSCVQDLGDPGIGNLGLDPLFVDIDGADDVAGTQDDLLALSAGSPAIDAAALGLLPADVADLDDDGDVSEKLPFDADFGARRFDDPATPDTGPGTQPSVDMGAFEFGAPLFHGLWVDVGAALAGLAGQPSLAGAGQLLGGDPFSLELSAARPFATAFLVLGLAEVSAPFKGGSLVPSPDLVLAVPVASDGGQALAATWPTGLPPAASLWWQWWIVDPAGPLGFAASNAVQSRAP